MAVIKAEQAQSYSDFSKNLMAICALHGKTNQEVSSLCGVTEDTVMQWKTGKVRIPIACAYKISKFLGIRMI